MKNTNEYIAKQIRDYRARNSITQADFAKKIEVSRSTLSLIEKGELTPSLETFLLISREINLNLQKVFDEAAKDIIILDTNIFLNRPQFIETIVEDCSLVYIPQTVINELNHKKDHAKSLAQRKCAALCMNKIQELKTKESIIIYGLSKIPANISNDDLIFATAEEIASDYKRDHVYLLTNDIYFKLKDSKHTNLKVIKPIEYDTIFHPDHKNEYNSGDYARLISLIKSSNYEELGKFDLDSVNINESDSETGDTPLIISVKQLAKIKKNNASKKNGRVDRTKEESAKKNVRDFAKPEENRC